eukprot:TRINITY_DN5210_c4_g1_i1.p1 TRINITY_DN5210_c4_g1~~TRINITY_DN5210_c4_g1_i1.p1  ORF type:complete len:232 (+),score=31.80 TRINITY_DN5210_c4_g1_i1:44-739(+)
MVSEYCTFEKLKKQREAKERNKKRYECDTQSSFARKTSTDPLGKVRSITPTRLNNRSLTPPPVGGGLAKISRAADSGREAFQKQLHNLSGGPDTPHVYSSSYDSGSIGQNRSPGSGLSLRSRSPRFGPNPSAPDLGPLYPVSINRNSSYTGPYHRESVALQEHKGARIGSTARECVPEDQRGFVKRRGHSGSHPPPSCGYESSRRSRSPGGLSSTFGESPSIKTYSPRKLP